ncbi:MAG: lipase maturation factor family protein, partial [Bdellovibrionota bacterium]
MEDSANASSENAPPPLGEGAAEQQERALSRPAATHSQGERGIKPPPSLLFTRRFYLAGLALVYAIAFLSLWMQVHGLVGSQGILPAEDFVKIATERLGAERFYLLPTLSWIIGAGDGALHFLCAAGFLSSLAFLAGFAPVMTGALCWIFYLSLYTVCREFLGFQWDILLLETGFLSLFLAPLRALSPWSPAWREPPRFLPVLALRVLLFKLMFSSGVVKLSGGDPTWRDLTALAYHYETTCLPAWTSWYVHQLPLWFHKISALGMYGIELVVPFFVFGPRIFRFIAAAGFFFLMAFIGATGNYGFFNIQSVMLCVILLDDAILPKWLNPGPSPRRSYSEN